MQIRRISGWSAAVLAASLSFPVCALALPSPPSLKPRPVLVSEHAERRQFELLVAGLRAANAADWAAVRGIRAQATDEAVTDILLWRLGRAPGANFGDRALALERLQDWPDMRGARIRAEAGIDHTDLSAREKYRWLIDNPPISGAGKLALAATMRGMAPISTGKVDTLVREAWRKDRLPRSTVKAMLAEERSPLTADDHRSRADWLLWNGRHRETRLLLPHLRRADRRLAEARLALRERRPGVDLLIARVPENLVEDPGLLFDRARWRRRKGRIAHAVPLLLKLRSAEAPESVRSRIWSERNIAIRYLIRERRFEDAYALATDHGLEGGVHYAEAEWTAGWLALRRLGRPLAAAAHFRDLARAVKTPISTARAQYWLGRAWDALERTDDARAAYARAAAWPFTFYGQLAAERQAALSGRTARLDLPPRPAPSAAQQRAFANRPLVRAAILLADAGERADFERFSTHIDDRLDIPEEHLMLAGLAQAYMQPRAALRAAKSGLSRGAATADAAWPKHALPESRASEQVEEALVLALSRQESEFNQHAESHAGAMGLMQLMPQTARGAARRAGLSFRPSWLKDDPHYNITLGRAHLDSLVKRFDGSYVMALAAYNAGERRPAQWARDYGDPRSGLIDIVDWIESIPYSETRNYVQRVMESLQVYRHRLQGEPVPISLSSDLRRGQRSSGDPS